MVDSILTTEVTMYFIIDLWVDGCNENKEDKEQFRKLLKEYIDFGASSVSVKIIDDTDTEFINKYFPTQDTGDSNIAGIGSG